MRRATGWLCVALAVAGAIAGWSYVGWRAFHDPVAAERGGDALWSLFTIAGLAFTGWILLDSDS